MPKLSVQVRRPPARQSPSVALVAQAAPRESILAALERQRFAVRVCASIEDVSFVMDAGRRPSAIVVWVQRTTSSMGRSIAELVERFPRASVVVVSPATQPRHVRTALTAGAAGVVSDAAVDSALAPCLRAVLAGQICVPRTRPRQDAPRKLSVREKQILGLVVMGYMNGQIAERLFLAESTVKSHLSSAFAKLGVGSRNEAVSLIIDPERGLGMEILALEDEPLRVSGYAAADRASS